MADKPKMAYRASQCHNPFTKEVLMRPLVVNRTVLNKTQLVAYAKSAGFVRGQQEDLEGLLGGFIEAMKDRAKAGCVIDVTDWFMITGTLKGSLDETQTLGANNEYCVRIRPKQQLKASIDDFSWTRVDAEAQMRITGVFGTSQQSGIINPKGLITANGTNLASVTGDTLTLTWKEGEEEKTSEITNLTLLSDLAIAARWPAELSIPEGTEVKLTYRLHRTAEGRVHVVTKTVTVGAEVANNDDLNG